MNEGSNRSHSCSALQTNGATIEAYAEERGRKRDVRRASMKTTLELGMPPERARILLALLVIAMVIRE